MKNKEKSNNHSKQYKKIGYEYERWNKDKKDKYESVQRPKETRKKAKSIKMELVQKVK